MFGQRNLHKAIILFCILPALSCSKGLLNVCYRGQLNFEIMSWTSVPGWLEPGRLRPKKLELCWLGSAQQQNLNPSLISKLMAVSYLSWAQLKIRKKWNFKA